MDNKEAIKVIRSNWPDLKYSMLIEALEMSIKSLEAAESSQTAHNSAIRPCPYQLVERHADNGALSHYELIEVATGVVVWSQPE
jgi:hypothetical protein